jgi:hypothetical protein
MRRAHRVERTACLRSPSLTRRLPGQTPRGTEYCVEVAWVESKLEIPPQSL